VMAVFVFVAGSFSAGQQISAFSCA